MSHSESGPASPSYPGDVLERGDRGADVRALQERLNDVLGGPDLDVDGRYGSLTERAVERFQRAEGLAVDGEVGPKTWAALFDDDATAATAIGKAAAQVGSQLGLSLGEGAAGVALAYPGDVLERGDRGADVRALQERLNDVLGGPDLDVDGRYGSLTERAVERFQRAEGLAVDGEVGPKTWAALFDDDATAPGGGAPPSTGGLHYPENTYLNPDYALLGQSVLGRFELADAAYHTSGAPQGWTRLDDNQLSAMGLSPDRFHPTGSFFRAYLFHSEDGQTVLSFKGSDEPAFTRDAGSDWFNDLVQGLGLEADYYTRAIHLAQQVSTQTHGHFELTGHSLGGGMAAAAAIVTGAHATTFNAAGVNSHTVDDYDKSAADASRAMADGRPLVDSYIVKGEVLDDIQRYPSAWPVLAPVGIAILGATHHLPVPAAGATHYLPDPDPLLGGDRYDPTVFVGHAISLHATDQVYAALMNAHIL